MVETGHAICGWWSGWPWSCFTRICESEIETIVMVIGVDWNPIDRSDRVPSKLDRSGGRLTPFLPSSPPFSQDNLVYVAIIPIILPLYLRNHSMIISQYCHFLFKWLNESHDNRILIGDVAIESRVVWNESRSTHRKGTRKCKSRISINVIFEHIGNSTDQT
jgi:hypothetical protein